MAVEAARVEGMKDFLVVSSTHSFIMNNPDVMEQARHFIEHGEFSRYDDGG